MIKCDQVCKYNFYDDGCLKPEWAKCPMSNTYRETEVKQVSNIIDISENEPHLVCEVIDLKCLYRWIAVYPESTLLKQLECPNCGAVGFVIKTGQELDGGDAE